LTYRGLGIAAAFLIVREWLVAESEGADKQMSNSAMDTTDIDPIAPPQGRCAAH